MLQSKILRQFVHIFGSWRYSQLLLKTIQSKHLDSINLIYDHLLPNRLNPEKLFTPLLQNFFQGTADKVHSPWITIPEHPANQVVPKLRSIKSIEFAHLLDQRVLVQENHTVYSLVDLWPITPVEINTTSSPEPFNV